MSWREQAKFGILSAESFFLGNGNGSLGEDVTSGVGLLADADVLAFLTGVASGNALQFTSPQIMQPDFTGPLSGDNHEYVARGFGNGGAGEYNINILATYAGASNLGGMGPLTLQQETSPGVFGLQQSLIFTTDNIDPGTGLPDGTYNTQLYLDFFRQISAQVPCFFGATTAYSYKLGYGNTFCSWIRPAGGPTSQVSGVPLIQYYAAGGMFTVANWGGAGDESLTVELDFADATHGSNAKGVVHYFTINKNAHGKALTIELLNGWTWDGTNSKVAFAGGGSLVFVASPALGKQVCLISSNGGVLAP